jgi:hypothetical protein
MESEGTGITTKLFTSKTRTWNVKSNFPRSTNVTQTRRETAQRYMFTTDAGADEKPKRSAK